MTKEELKKEAEKNSFRYTLDKPWVCEVERKQIMAHFEKGYLAGAEPREKQIEDLEETINKLREQFALRYDLEDKLRKENAEKMKQAEQFLEEIEKWQRKNLKNS